MLAQYTSATPVGSNSKGYFLNVFSAQKLLAKILTLPCYCKRDETIISSFMKVKRDLQMGAKQTAH